MTRLEGIVNYKRIVLEYVLSNRAVLSVKISLFCYYNPTTLTVNKVMLFYYGHHIHTLNKLVTKVTSYPVACFLHNTLHMNNIL